MVKSLSVRRKRTGGFWSGLRVMVRTEALKTMPSMRVGSSWREVVMVHRCPLGNWGETIGGDCRMNGCFRVPRMGGGSRLGSGTAAMAMAMMGGGRMRMLRRIERRVRGDVREGIFVSL